MYAPIQPTSRFGDKIDYVERLPDARLQRFIVCYWEFKSQQPFREDFRANIVSDACIDIFFETTNPSTNFVFGFCRKSMTFQFGTSFRYVGIRFCPAMFPYLFNINASEFSNRVERLELIHRDTAQFIAKMVAPDQGINELVHLFDTYFLLCVSKLGGEIDNRLYHAVLNVLSNSGTPRIAKDLHVEAGVSPRHLRRLFDFYIGDSIKSFCKVVRFQKFLRGQFEVNRPGGEKMFYDFGYYDQSHFIREFKNCYGETPGAVFR